MLQFYFIFFEVIILSTAVLLSVRSGVQCAPLCLSGDFDSQLQHILRQDMLSAQETADILSQVLDDVERTLSQRWQGYEIFICGSLATGLATKASDVDMVIRLPNFNSSASLYVLHETETLFMKNPTLYSQLRYSLNVVYISSLFSFFHIPSQRHVDIEFHTGDISVANTRNIRYYFKLDERFLPLGGFLKYWFKVHGLTGHEPGSLPNYGLYLLIIFYLQQKNMAPPGYVLQINSKSHITNDGWDVGFNELPYRSENTESLHQLLGGFFKYYSEFDFERQIVSPFAGRPIPRNAFIDIDNFPNEYTLNNNMSTKRLEVKKYWTEITTDVCIQDVFVHSSNTVEQVSHEVASKFKHLLKSVATMFEDVPGESVLIAIFSHNNATVDGLNKQDCN